MARSSKQKVNPRKPARGRPSANPSPAPPSCPCGECGSDEALARKHERWRQLLGLLGEREARLYAAEKALEQGEGGVAVLARITGWPAAVIEEAVAVLESGPPPAERPVHKVEAEAAVGRDAGPRLGRLPGLARVRAPPGTADDDEARRVPARRAPAARHLLAAVQPRHARPHRPDHHQDARDRRDARGPGLPVRICCATSGPCSTSPRPRRAPSCRSWRPARSSA